MKSKILLLTPLMPEIEAALKADFDVIKFPHDRKNLDDLKPHAAGIDAIVTGGVEGVPTPLMAALPQVKIIAINGVGTDAVDLKEAARRMIKVATTQGVLTDDVADLAMGLIIACLRQICVGDHFVRQGAWAKGETMGLAHKVSGKKLGIYGFGKIGQAIAQRAQAFSMPIKYTDFLPISGFEQNFEKDLVELAKWADILVVAASGGAGSYHTVNRAVLDALGPKGVLVNIARGSIVDEPALVAALQEKCLGGAGIDAFEHEPLVAEALFAMPNIVLQPHRASATIETRLEMGRIVIENLKAVLA